MAEVKRDGGNPILAFVGGGLMIVVAAMGLFLYSGGSFGPKTPLEVSVSLPPSPGAAGD